MRIARDIEAGLIQEVNACKCKHGAMRHADRLVAHPNNPGVKGYICLIADCACYSYRGERPDSALWGEQP